MNVGVFLNYVGLGSNILHLTYCHEIAKKYGPVTIITLCKNLSQALEDDPCIKEVIIIKKNKKITDIPNISILLKKISLNKIFIFYPSPRLYIAAKLAGIKNVYSYPLFRKKNLHLVNAANKFTCESLNIDSCPTETKFFIDHKKIDHAKKYFAKDNYNIVIGAGSSGPDTRWGEKNFISLINKLNAIGNYYFYIQCGPEQNEISKNIINKIKNKKLLFFGISGDISKSIILTVRKAKPKILSYSFKKNSISIKEMRKLEKFLKVNKPHYIFYLSSPPIMNDTQNNTTLYNVYNDVYTSKFKIILNLLQKNSIKSKIFYPSSIFLNNKKKYLRLKSYLRAKDNAEKICKSHPYSKFIKCFRLPQFKTGSNYNILGFYNGIETHKIRKYLVKFF